MIGTKADIAKVLIDGLNGETITQPAATYFRLGDVAEVLGMMIAAVANGAQSFVGQNDKIGPKVRKMSC